MENMINAIELQENELNDVSGGGFMNFFDKAKDMVDALDATTDKAKLRQG